MNYADLAAELAKPAYSGLSDADAAAALAAQTTTRQALRPLTSTAALLSLVSPTSFAAVFDHPRFTDFKATFDSGSRAGVAEWATAFAARGLITTAERDAVIAFVSQPASAACSPGDLIGWPVVTALDVAHARSL